MTATDLESLIVRGENSAVEFKRARGGVPADFWPSYSAFANTEGGLIVLGVREKEGKREIEGLTDVERICADLWNAAFSRPSSIRIRDCAKRLRLSIRRESRFFIRGKCRMDLGESTRVTF